MNGVKNADESDYIIISDIDEIPDLSKLNHLKNFKYTVFEQKMYYYKINLQNNTDPVWFGSKICKKKDIKSPQWLRKQKVKKFPFWKFYKIKWNIIKNGGWHFSFLMNTDQIKKKLNAYAHAEYNNSKFNNYEKINNSINQRIDLFNREINFEKIPFDKTFPEYIFNNQEKFKDWIL